MATTNKEMYVRLLKDTIITLLIVATVIGVLVFILHGIYKTPFAITTPSLIFGVIGTTLAFMGGIFSNDAINRWGGATLPQWKWGNRIQMAGFAFVVVALLIK